MNLARRTSRGALLGLLGSLGVGLGSTSCSVESRAPGSGGTAPGSAGGQGGGAGGEATLEDDCVVRSGVCELVECAAPIAGADHTPACVALTYDTNPPTSGTHYGVWAAFQIYVEPVARGFLVHSLEHSAIVLSYNCSLAEQAGLDCDGLVSDLTQLWNDWPEDPLCTASRHRLIVTPDPLLDVPFAAAAWGHYLKGGCFDLELVSNFISAHYGQTYENICVAGVDPASYPADCGQ